MYYIFYNPQSGLGKGKETALDIKRTIKEEYKMFNLLEHEGKVQDIIDKMNDKDIIVVIGGDGTLCYFLNHNEVRGKSLYFYPCGTGNDFIRNFGDAKYVDYTHLVDKAKCFVNGEELTVVNGVGAGVDGQIIHNYHNARFHNKRSYLFNTLKAFFTYRRTDVNLKIDGKEYSFKKCYFVVINNGKYIGGGMNICPRANVHDGLLDVCVVHDCSLLKLITKFPLVYKGTHIDDKKLVDKIFYTECKTIEYSAKEARFLQYDGETYEKVREFKVSIDE